MLKFNYDTMYLHSETKELIIKKSGYTYSEEPGTPGSFIEKIFKVPYRENTSNEELVDLYEELNKLGAHGKVYQQVKKIYNMVCSGTAKAA